jgi:hypothetical protein
MSISGGRLLPEKGVFHVEQKEEFDKNAAECNEEPPQNIIYYKMQNNIKC